MKWFSVPANSTGCIVSKRWPDGVVRCPSCGRKDVRYLASRGLWECKTRHPRSQFSIRTGTILEDSHIPVHLWLAAIWMAANAARPNSHELARRLGITQKSAWSLLRRIKFASQKSSGGAEAQRESAVRDREAGSLRRE
jgi:hypothetical protein